MLQFIVIIYREGLMETAELLPPPAAIPASELIVLDETGDSRIQWNKNDPDQVAAAQARFAELKTRGYLAYRVDPSGRQGEVIDKFDPAAERIILHQRMIGG
jgi:hypothetical protein